MNTYKIIHREELVDWFYIEAESEEAAISEYNRLVAEGKIDFSNMEMVDSSDTAILDDIDVSAIENIDDLKGEADNG